MGLTLNSTGSKAIDMGFAIKKTNNLDKVIALAGNPNVGKSTVFNALTGLKQHTGNWAGKTVTNAQGIYKHNGKNYIMVDIPGTYSLIANSKEEEIARDFICFGNPDAVVVVCDATCLERNLNLVLQTVEITNNVIVCVNLMDEAKKKKISIDLDGISEKLGVPVIGVTARNGKGLNCMMDSISYILENPNRSKNILQIKYTKPIEKAIDELTNILEDKLPKSSINLRWIALRLLDYDKNLIENIGKYFKIDVLNDEQINNKLNDLNKYFEENVITHEKLKDNIISSIILQAEDICNDTVKFNNYKYNEKDRKIDKILTSRLTGFPIMIVLLAIVFWLTISFSNIPSSFLSNILFSLEAKLVSFCIWIGIPKLIYEILIFGVYRVLAWVVSVMLPPMAIFFPIFTLLEDLGFLPRLAFNLDKTFKKCSACGKQALTMCMGFGCNAAGIVGCRIIDSPRERLIAIITNNFVPCNGRFPSLISIISMFFISNIAISSKSVLNALFLTLFILLGICTTFIISKLLSKTILKGESSSFTLELPPYRKPQIGKVIIRSIFDRTLFVLGRAIKVAAPAGLIIWIFANTYIGNLSILAHFSNFLDPFAKLIGLDGVILLAFILGLPANEIVIPIIIMAYTSMGTLTELNNLTALKELLISHNWTFVTAICTMIFFLMHWPCSTTLLTIKKETNSLKWTIVSFLIPTITGIISCFIVAQVAKIFI